MATNSYTLQFSDPNKDSTITVDGVSIGPGKNNYDTSLSLIGPGYTNYGLDVNQNFLKLLENFAGPNAPSHSIEGQLWYDTTNPERKVLRINNGSPDSTRWSNISGIYQQTTDPCDGYSAIITDGDIWVDTTAFQLKIRDGSEWKLVGPNLSDSGAGKTGQETVVIKANDEAETEYPVILHWVNGSVVEIISFNEFTPKSVIDGFPDIVGEETLKPGSNLTTKPNFCYNGLATRAASLELPNGTVVSSTEIIRNNSVVKTGTVISFAGSSAPAGFLPCDGAAYFQSEYPDLYGIIGSDFGSESPGKFLVPDLPSLTPISGPAIKYYIKT